MFAVVLLPNLFRVKVQIMAARGKDKGKSSAKSLVPAMNNQTQSGVLGGGAGKEQEELSEGMKEQRNSFLWCVAQIAQRAEAVSADDIAALIRRNENSLFAITGVNVHSISARPGECISIRMCEHRHRWNFSVADVFGASKPVMENPKSEILKRTLYITGEHAVPSASSLVS